MIVLQIIYLALNIVGLVIGLAGFLTSDEFPFVSSFFSAISRKCGNIVLAITSLLCIALFLPALAAITAIITFTMIWHEYSK